MHIICLVSFSIIDFVKMCQIITIRCLDIKLPDILFNDELDGAAFSHACEFCKSFACKEREKKRIVVNWFQWHFTYHDLMSINLNNCDY